VVQTWNAGGFIAHSFNVDVPALGGYQYTLFNVRHTPAGYPVYVDMRPGQSTDMTPSRAKEIADEGEFRNWLRETLHSDEVKRIIENLYAQAST